jgi:DNA-binding CsgD family transcriptional regulator
MKPPQSASTGRSRRKHTKDGVVIISLDGEMTSLPSFGSMWETDSSIGQFVLSLRRHGVPEDVVPGVVEALVDSTSAAQTPSVTEAEREFALSAGIPESAFSAEAAASNRLYLLQSAARDAERLSASLIPTAEVAELLGTSPDNVRQQAMRGKLYAAGVVAGQKAFPRWQFVDGKALPGLRQVIAAMPTEYAPLDVEAVMTDPDERLNDRSPLQWLAGGGAVEPVLELVEELSYL